MTSQSLIDLLEEELLNVRPYSGRGMMGKECVGVSGSSVWEVARRLPQKASIPEPITGQLGTGIIIYWPEFEWPKQLNQTKGEK
jgi:hypothetical protein